MFDYTHVMTARKEYEERAHASAHQPYTCDPKPGGAGRLLTSAGNLLVRAGEWLQAHGRSPQVQPTSVPDTF